MGSQAGKLLPGKLASCWQPREVLVGKVLVVKRDANSMNDGLETAVLCHTPHHVKEE